MLLNILTIYKTGLFHNNALVCSKLQTHCLYSIARQLLSVLILYSSLFSLDCSHHTILHIVVLGPGLPLLFLTSRGIQQTVSSQKITIDEMCELSIIEKWQFTGLSQNSSLTNEYWHWTFFCVIQCFCVLSSLVFSRNLGLCYPLRSELFRRPVATLLIHFISRI